MQAFTFHKSERLCSSSGIAKLFSKGSRFYNRFPFRFSWLATSHSGLYPAQVLFVVSKKHFPKATLRNKIKRQLRELYRYRKHLLYEKAGNKQLIISIAYMGKAPLPFAELQTLFEQAFHEWLTRMD